MPNISHKFAGKLFVGSDDYPREQASAIIPVGYYGYLSDHTVALARGRMSGWRLASGWPGGVLHNLTACTLEGLTHRWFVQVDHNWLPPGQRC